MNKLWQCIRKDVTLSFKSFYFYMEVGMALIFAAILIFAVPVESTSAAKVYAVIELPGAEENNIFSGLEGQGMALEMLGSRQDIVDAMENDRSAVGLHAYVADDRLVFEYILQGYEGEKFRNIMGTAIKAGIASLMGEEPEGVQVQTLGRNLEKLDPRLNLLPVFLTLNAAFMGLFIIAAYIFLDKEEGTIKALAVTPASVWHYLMSKLVVMLITGVATSLVVLLLVAGRKPDYLLFMVAIIAFNAFGSALGLLIASFFDGMSKAMGWLYFTVIMLGFASVSYFSPAFSPLAVRLLPSYPMLFSFREILLDSGDKGYVLRTAAGFLAAAAALFVLADRSFRKSITV